MAIKNLLNGFMGGVAIGLVAWGVGNHNTKINDSGYKTIDNLVQEVISPNVITPKEIEPEIKDSNVKEVSTYIYPKIEAPKIAAPFMDIDPKYENVIVLDPGHGGKDPGASYPLHSKPPKSTYLEKLIVFEQASRTKELLEENGYFNVYMTRGKGEFISLDGRVNFARNLNADLFLSFHTNSTDKNKNAHGQLTYYFLGEGSHEFAKIMQEKMVEKIGSNYQVKDLGVIKRNLRVLNGGYTAAYIESGFSSNTQERKALKENAYFVAKATYQAIDTYLGGLNENK